MNKTEENYETIDKGIYAPPKRFQVWRSRKGREKVVEKLTREQHNKETRQRAKLSDTQEQALTALE
jgi:hypothetical protein